MVVPEVTGPVENAFPKELARATPGREAKSDTALVRARRLREAIAKIRSFPTLDK